ncbi:gamma-glutamyltransferase [Salmonella enterica subsp. enterica]|nr:gamma-glutamyltransferase [Salmonella enterica subsp. enterica]
MDKDGNAVAVTHTLNTPGTGIVAGNTGILLNNQMDDLPNPVYLMFMARWAAMLTRSARKKRPAVVDVADYRQSKEGKPLVTGSPGGKVESSLRCKMVVNSIDLYERRRSDQRAAFPSSMVAGRTGG